MIGRAGLWLLGVAGLCLLLAALAASGRLSIHSDLLALLPTPQRDPVKAAALDRLAELGERQAVIMIGGSAAGSGRADAAARAVVAALSKSPSFTHVLAGVDDLLAGDRRAALQKLLFTHRFHLLAPADAAALQRLAEPPAGDNEAARAYFMDRARAALYGLGVGNTGRFTADPLGLADAYRHSVIANPAPGLRVAANGRFYVIDTARRRYAVVFAESRQDPFTLSAQSGQMAALDAARAAARATTPDAEILASGVVRHAAAASERARREVTLIGSGSLIGILALMLWAFGSVRPFVLSLAAIAGGVLLATVVTAGVFGGLHVLTLVFGASLVGVAVDYGLHFFAQRWHTPAPKTALRRILPAVTLGLITSALAYGGMGLAPFPGLRQIAVFAATGLFGAWLGVILLLPAGAGATPRRGHALALALARGWLARGPGRFAAIHPSAVLWLMGAAFVLLAMVAFATLSPDDDVRLLYDPPPDLRHTDKKIAGLLGAPIAARGVLVQGNSPAAVLRADAAVVHALNASAKPVADVTAISQAYTRPAEQRRYYAQLADTLYARAGPLDSLLAEAGFKPAAIRAHRRDFAVAHGRILALDKWLASPASASRRGLWLGSVDHRWASLIRVRQVNDAAALARIIAQNPNAQMLDRVAEISGLIGRYRHRTTWLLAVAYALAGLLLCWPFGARGALAVLMPPMLASVVVAVIFAAAGWPFSLFNLLALILLLGLGADYGIFLRMAGSDRAPAMLAVALSAATTLLAFGLLAASATPALHGFGLTLAIGLIMTFLLASLIGGRRE